MRNDKEKLPRKQVSRFAALAAGLATAAFLLVVVYEAFHIAHNLNDALLNAGEIFQKSIPLGTLITISFFIVLVTGLIQFHIDELSSRWMRVSKHFSNVGLPVRYSVGSISVAGVLVTALVFFPRSGDTQDGKKSEIVRKSDRQLSDTKMAHQSLDAQDAASSYEQTKFKQTVAVPAFPVPRPRMAGRDVCNLYEDPTDSEWNACALDNSKHPTRKGIGGPLCIMVNSQIKCLPVPAPLPRARPPLNLLPDIR